MRRNRSAAELAYIIKRFLTHHKSQANLTNSSFYIVRPKHASPPRGFNPSLWYPPYCLFCSLSCIMGDAMAQTDPENVAAVHVQRVVRGFLGRMAALRQANLIYEKIYDPRTHIHYYYNTITCETAWQVPSIRPLPLMSHWHCHCFAVACGSIIRGDLPFRVLSAWFLSVRVNCRYLCVATPPRFDSIGVSCSFLRIR